METTTIFTSFVSRQNCLFASRALAIGFFIAVLAVIATGCIARPGVKSVRVTGESKNRKTNETRAYFMNDDEPIIALVELTNISKPVKLTTEWRYLARGTVVYSSEETADKKGEFRIRLNRKPNESEFGDYRIDVLINGEIVALNYFSIVEELPEPPPYDVIKKEFEKKYGATETPVENERPVLADCATASEVFGLTQAPKELRNTFQPNTPVVYLTMFMSEAPLNTKIRVDWYFLGKDGATEMLIIPAELETSGTRQLAFNMKPGTGDLPVGKYEARVFLNDKEFIRVPFTVVELEGAKPSESTANDAKTNGK